MEIYTVVMTKESFETPPTMEVFGSFTNEAKAKANMVSNIVKMAKENAAFSYAMWDDENHEDFSEYVGREYGNVEECGNLFMRERDKAHFPPKLIAAMYNYLNGEIGDDEGTYHVYSATGFTTDSTFTFDVRKNELEED